MRPQVLLFDVNETLSDMAPLAERFRDVGVPGEYAAAWFAGVLRDGIALAVNGEQAAFADVAAEALRAMLGGREDAVRHVMEGFMGLDVHPDVPEGVRALARLGIRLVTLSNGSASVAEGLLDRAGLADRFERLLSVEGAGVWKPAPAAYGYALRECGVEPAEAMLVAIHPWDTDGAARAGLRSAWLNRDGGPFPAYFRAPDVEIRSLPELAELLR
jgi:2-haloacid dehalogenase